MGNFTRTTGAFDDSITSCTFEIRVRNFLEPSTPETREDRLEFRVLYPSVMENGVNVGAKHSKWKSMSDGNVSSFNQGDTRKQLALCKEMYDEGRIDLDIIE